MGWLLPKMVQRTWMTMVLGWKNGQEKWDMELVRGLSPYFL